MMSASFLTACVESLYVTSVALMLLNFWIVRTMEVIDEYQQGADNVIVVISDWLMPHMKGDEFLVQVHGKHPRIVKIMLTGQASEAAISRAKKDANLFRCISKPWSEKELVESIREAIKLTHT
jgi:response regulator RpfG family c-di-GMP phosphodiesterase